MFLRRTVLAAAFAALLPACRSAHAPPVSLEGVPAAQLRRAKSNVRVFDAAWSMIADDYYDRTLHGVDWNAAAKEYGPRAAVAADDDALYTVLNEMLGLLGDPHTRALTPKQAADRERHATALIGIAAVNVDGRWAVAEVTGGSPAETAGVRPGWVLLARNGAPFERAEPAREEQRETLDFLDAEDRPLRLALAPQTLSTRPEGRVRELPDGIAVLRLDGFDRDLQRWLDHEIEAHQAAPALVLDVRRNRGGQFDALVAALGSFFDDRIDCGQLLSRGGDRREESTRPCKTAHYGGPLAVLVDASTASAAEILAAVLKDQKRATIVGRKTRGAVLGSRHHPLPDDGLLGMSGLDYVTPTGRRLEGEGVVPDVPTRLTLADLRRGTDPDLEAALRVLRSPQTAR